MIEYLHTRLMAMNTLHFAYKFWLESVRVNSTRPYVSVKWIDGLPDRCLSLVAKQHIN
jgi:hypothetical protein